MTQAGLPTQRYADRQEKQLVEWISSLEGTVQSQGRQLNAALARLQRV